MDATLHTLLVAVGQMLLGSLYVYAGLNHFGPAAQKIIPALAARGVPSPQQTLFVVSALEILGGACLMLGIAVVPAAIGLAIFTVVASYVMVNFWDLPKGSELRAMLEGVFASNVAIIGGLLLAAAQAL
jgi:putative oxidoreductase